MKYFLVIAFVLVLVWLWRQSRQAEKKAAPPPRAGVKEKGVTEMVACNVCHVHLPRSEALPGRGGFYCSEAHRSEAGR